MDIVAQSIPVIHKASNVCAYCRVRKQRCDRNLPKCERCAVKGRNCDYTPYKEPPRHESHDSEPLVVHHEFCWHADLTPRGTKELLHVIIAYLNDPNDSISATRLSELVYEILDYADVNLRAALEEFGPCIQQWCPIMLENMLLGFENDLSQQMLRGDDLKNPLLWLCLWLVTRRACQHPDHVTRSELYRAIKQITSVLQSRSQLHLEALQLGMLITVYEVGHGLHTQAFQTLAASVALLRMLELDSRGIPTQSLDTVRWLKASILMLDRMIPISMSSSSLPLTVLSADPISRSLAKTINPVIPPHPLRPCASSPRKVHIRAAVSLASGHVLEHIHAQQHAFEPEQSYEEADTLINKCIKMLVDKPEPHTWLHCDAIAMAFCSHILLQYAQMQHLCTMLRQPNTLEAPAPEYIKAHLALKYSRRMAWDMVRVAISKIQSESEIPHLPFAGLCCVFRAGLAVLETSVFVEEDVVSGDDIQGFGTILGWFAGRWSIGKDYLGKLEELHLGSP